MLTKKSLLIVGIVAILALLYVIVSQNSTPSSLGSLALNTNISSSTRAPVTTTTPSSTNVPTTSVLPLKTHVPTTTTKSYNIVITTSGYGKCFSYIKSISVNDQSINTRGTTMSLPAGSQAKISIIYTANVLNLVGTTYNYGNPTTLITTTQREFSVPVARDTKFSIKFSPYLSSCIGTDNPPPGVNTVATN